MIFDGSTYVKEALAIVVRFIDVDQNVRQRLVRVQLPAKSLCGEEIAKEVISSTCRIQYYVRPVIGNNKG